MSVTDETSFLGMGDRLALKKTQDWSVIGLSAGLVSLDTWRAIPNPSHCSWLNLWRGLFGQATCNAQMLLVILFSELLNLQTIISPCLENIWDVFIVVAAGGRYCVVGFHWHFKATYVGGRGLMAWRISRRVKREIPGWRQQRKFGPGFPFLCSVQDNCHACPRLFAIQHTISLGCFWDISPVKSLIPQKNTLNKTSGTTESGTSIPERVPNEPRCCVLSSS